MSEPMNRELDPNQWAEWYRNPALSDAQNGRSFANFWNTQFASEFLVSNEEDGEQS